MKKFSYVLALALLVTSFSYAQDFKKFRVGIGLGYAKASGNGSGGGVIFALEPSYRLQDNISLGLKMEAAAVTRGYSQDIGSASISVAGIGSYTLNGQYYFGKGSSFRPFVGAGLGLYSLAAVSVDLSSSGGSSSTSATAAESKIGFYPRVGFDLGHFNITIDYNIISPTKDALGGGGEFKNSYIGFRLGAYIGGGKK
jgi:hypothetical protein